jgi:predicted  nucleic acid-binding Zn-ribbon protein
MDKNLAGLKQAQEEFHQAFDNRLEDAEDKMLVCKTDVDVFRIQISSMEKDIKDVEMSVDNTHLRLEKVEDQVNEFVTQLQHSSQVNLTNSRSLGLEIQRVQRESRADHESLLGKFAANNTIINRKFVHLDEEMEKVVDLIGQKIDVKFREFSSDFMEVMEIEENQRKDLKAKVAGLEERLEHTLTHTANLATLLLSVQSPVVEVKDVIMEESGD